MTTFGEVSWEEEFSGEKKANNKDVFLKLDSGSNELRLVTQPYQYLVHKYKAEGEKGFGRNIMCSAVHGTCAVCQLQNKAKTRWLLGVISRKTNTFKILDMSYAVFSQIRKLAKNTVRWGDPTKYDIDVVVDKNGGATGYYSVQPLPKEALSAADQKIRDNIDLEDLKRRVTPLTPDQVQKKLEKLMGDAGVVSTKSTNKTPSPVSTSDDDDDSSFPSYDAET